MVAGAPAGGRTSVAPTGGTGADVNGTAEAGEEDGGGEGGATRGATVGAAGGATGGGAAAGGSGVELRNTVCAGLASGDLRNTVRGAGRRPPGMVSTFLHATH